MKREYKDSRQGTGGPHTTHFLRQGQTSYSLTRSLSGLSVTSGARTQADKRRPQHAALAADGGCQQTPELGGARFEGARQAGAARCAR